MSVSNDLQRSKVISANRKEIKNLQAKHQNELDKMKIQHEKRKGQTRVSNSLELSSLHNDHERQLAAKVQRNEEAYTKLQESLDQVKTQTQKEKDRLKAELERQSEFDKANFEMQMKDRKLQKQLTLEDLDHQANTELNRLNFEIKTKRKDIEQTQNHDLAMLKTESLHKKDMDKNQYQKERLTTNEKFFTALQNLKKHQRSQIVGKERTHKTQLDNRDTQYQKEAEALKNDHARKKTQLKSNFEKQFEKNFEQNNNLMKNLIGKKEKFLDQVRQMVRVEAKKELAMKNDSFYHIVDLKPDVSETENKDGYILKIKVPEHELKKVKLTAHDREIRLSLDRDFDHKRVDEDGTKDSIRRSESYMTKIPVEDIINSKKISKSYENGELVFKIAKA